ncbi:hypothetical protein AKJ16_DCAP03868 [Drosera capensis]
MIVLREDSFFAEWDSQRGQSIFMPRVDSECINLGSETSRDIYKLEVQHLLEEISVVQPSGYSSASSDIDILSENEDWQSSQHVQHRIHGSDFSRKSSALSKQWINSSSALDVEVIDVDDIEEHCSSHLQEQLHYFSNEPFESNSEGLGTMVSCDGDSDDGFLNDKHIGDEEMMSICGTRESRDFSYVVDVVSQSGPGLLSMDALYPHVFDVLERKYGK